MFGLMALSKLIIAFRKKLCMSIKDSLTLALIVATYAHKKPLWASLVKRLVENKEFVFNIYVNEKQSLSIVYKCIDAYTNLWSNIFDVFIKKEYNLVPDFEPREGEVIVDAGAHVGLYACYAAKIAKKVIAFEPVQQNFQYLLLHKRINRLHNLIALPLALGDKEDVKTMYIGGDSFGSSTFYQKHVKVYEKYYPYVISSRVRVTTLDNIMQKLGIDEIDLCKIDVEGAERILLLGGQNLLRLKRIKKIVVEVHKSINNIEDVTSLLMYFGYKIKAVFEEAEKAIIYALCENFNHSM